MNVIVASRLSCCSSKQSPNRPTPAIKVVIYERRVEAQRSERCSKEKKAPTPTLTKGLEKAARKRGREESPAVVACVICVSHARSSCRKRRVRYPRR
jgi:hypothetical protein